MISYSQVVNNLKTSALNLTTVNMVGFGTIDKLDADAQNATYPYVFFRPLSSPGIRFGTQMTGPRVLTFEMYVMSLPYQTDTDYLDVMSNCEQIGYNVVTDFFDGNYEYLHNIQVNTLTPLNEAFQDRVVGWVFTMDVVTDSSGITSCNRV